jgi:hypothetical protein
VVICLLFSGFQNARSQSETENEQILRGKVILADGSPVFGAAVDAIAKCDGISFSRYIITAEDGSFSFPLFHRKMLGPDQSETDCKQYQFRASMKEDYWLSSDDNIFTGGVPTIPTVDLPLQLPLVPVQIVLSVRGGKVGFRVWDIATNRFVHAEIYLSRKPIEGKKFGSVQWKTRDDGEFDVQLLPPGDYSVEVQSYPCGTDEYWTASGPVNTFIVQPQTFLEEKISIDIRNIKPLPGDHGRRRENCKP